MRTIVHAIEGKLLIALRFSGVGSGRAWELWCLWMLIWGLLSSIGWLQASAEVAPAAAPSPAAQSTGSLPRGVVTTTANLRASPSMQSEVIAVAKDGAVIEILAESGRWYRIRADDGFEAWIGKSLVHLDTALLNRPTRSFTRSIPSEAPPVAHDVPVAPETLDLSPTTSEPLPTPVAPEKQEEPIALMSRGVPLSDREDIGFRGILATLVGRFENMEAYLIPLLVAILMLAIILQLRAARQLRRAMREMGEILDIVEELSATGRLQGTDGVHTLPSTWGRRAPAIRAQNPTVELSSIERAVLQALSAEHAVQETALAKTLAQQGYSGILLKAVIAEILRKTHTMGQALINVQYHEGQYRYKLRSGGLLHVADRS